MRCPKCGSTNVNVQMVTSSKLVSKHHSIFWWIPFGLIWTCFKWIFLTLPALIVKIFRPKRQKLKQRQISMCVCQTCGHHWEA